MKKITLITLLSVFTMNIFSQFIMKEEYIQVYPENKVIESFDFKNLRIYPLIGGDHFKDANKDVSEYTNLEEALRKNMVVITETNGLSGQVNTLHIENVSNDTVYILAGEVVKGGKQDRVIADDVMLLPKSGKMDLSVFCVEHHRWSYRSDRKNFDSYYSVSSNEVRKKASVEKDQGKVWQEVARITKENNAESSTGTYTALKNSEKYKNESNLYMEHFQKAFSEIDDCIGFVGVTGDKIIGCDIFATEALLNKQLKNLLNAYIAEAVTSGGKVNMEYKDVFNYLNDFLASEEDQDQNIMEKGIQYKFEGKKLHINTY